MTMAAGKLSSKRREISQIAEHHGPVERDSAEPEVVIGPPEDTVDHVLGHEAGEDIAHPLALQIVQPLSCQTAVDPSPQKHGVEGLRQVVLGPQLDAAHDALDVLERGDHDHRDVAQLAVRLHLREHLEAVDLRHDDVEQDDVEGFRTQNLQCPTAILRGREPMPFSLEATRKQQAVDRVVVDDKHVCLRSAPRQALPAKAPSAPSTRAYSFSIRVMRSPRCNCSRPSTSSSSSLRDASAVAPNVLPFDFNV